MDPVYFGRIQSPEACGERVVHLRLRCQAGTVSEDAESPAEVEILAIHEQGLVEARGFLERSTPSEHRAPASGVGLEIRYGDIAIRGAESDSDCAGAPIYYTT